MRAALRGLATDDWVIGLAAAIAIGYTTVLFVRSFVQLVVDVIRNTTSGGLSFTIADRAIAYESPALSGVTLVAVVLLSAVLLRRAKAKP